MSDPLFTLLKSHPSTWQQEVAQLRDENIDLILQAMASNGQAAQAHEERLVAEAEAKSMRARVATLEVALECIACRHVTVDPLWWQLMARVALQEGEG